MALGITKHMWSIGELLDAALAVAPPEPTDAGSTLAVPRH
jgi:hypothetical protein